MNAISAINGYRTSEGSAHKPPDVSVMSGSGFCTLQDKAIKL